MSFRVPPWQGVGMKLRLPDRRFAGTIGRRTGPGRVVVVMCTELDIATASREVQLADAAIQQALRTPPRVVHVDLSAMTFVDVVGTRALEQIAETASSRGVTVEFTGASRSVRHLLERTGGSHLLRMPA